MAQFDPSVISAIPDYSGNPIAAQEKAITMRDMMDRAQLNHLQLGAAKSQASEDAQAKEILKKSDYTTPAGVDSTAAQLNRVSPKAAMDFKKSAQQYQSGQVQNEIDQLTLHGARQDMIVQGIDPIVAQAREMKASGSSDLEVNAFIAKELPNTIQQLRGQTLSDGKPALPDDVLKMATGTKVDLATLEGWESKSKAGAAAIKSRLEQHKQDTVDKRENETERHNHELESAATGRLDVSRQKLERDKDGGLSGGAVDQVADQVISGDNSPLQGLSKQDRAAVRNRISDISQITGLKGKDLAANRAEFGGLMAGERTLANRQANIDTAAQEFQNVAPTVLEAARAVPRDKFVPMNKLMQIWDKNISDPELAKFAQGMRTLANLYTRATVPGASAVSDRDDAMAHLPTYTSQESLEATVQFMQKEIAAAKAAPRDVRADMRKNLTDQPGHLSSSPAGTSPGAASPSQGAGPAGAGAATKGTKYTHSSGATVEILD